MVTPKPPRPERRNRRPAAGSRSALEHGVALLARREYSRHELRRRMDARGFDAADAEAALAELAARGWQSDARYATLLARSRAAQGYGPRRIRMELAAQGIARDEAQAAVQALDHDWTRAATDLVRRRCGSLADAASRRRAAQMLLRRGFETATVRCVTRTGIEDAADGED